MQFAGIYKIHNLVNDKLYIGSSVHLFGRKNHHFCDLAKNRHGNAHLQNAFNKYGRENFVFQVLELCGEQRLIEKETRWVNVLRKHKFALYNVRECVDSNLGRKLSAEHKAKISAALIGKTKSAQHRANIAAAKLGELNPMYGKIPYNKKPHLN